MMNKKVAWNGQVQPEAINELSAEGGMIVCPTKVGYIIMTSDKEGLERKFEAKQRNRNKPGVVLCGSMEQLKSLAEMKTYYWAVFYRGEKMPSPDYPITA